MTPKGTLHGMGSIQVASFVSAALVFASVFPTRGGDGARAQAETSTKPPAIRWRTNLEGARLEAERSRRPLLAVFR
ncbi:MAG: hypothetical protein AAGG01_05880 [Planctomycetota bacterium]